MNHRNRTFSVACLLVLLLFPVWTTAQGPSMAEVSREVSREDVMTSAMVYANHTWVPSEKNMFHGIDPNGKHVETPDITYTTRPDRPKGWEPGKPFRGLPYKWGGFTSISQFDKGIAKGKYAGDVFTKKRGISRHAVGLDCSGYVSRCLGLRRHYSTRRLPRLCIELEDPKELKRGDILNRYDHHVVLFDSFTDEAKTRVRFYESRNPGVGVRESELGEMLDKGYVAMRYRGIRD